MADRAASSSLQLLQDIGRQLDAAGARWAAIGALAVAYHGWVRASLDADALITLKGAKLNLDRLAGSLREQGFTVDVRRGEEDDPLGLVVRIFDSAGNQVDLIGGIRKLDDGIFDRAIEGEIDGGSLRVAAVEDLIALKVFAGGPKDLEDAAGVIEVQGSTLDRALCLELCRRFGPEEERRGRTLLGL